MSDYSSQFKNEVRYLFNGLKFRVTDHKELIYDENKYHPDFVVTKNEVTAIVEINSIEVEKLQETFL